MFHSTSRDVALVDGLLPLFNREITADPEQRNRARREARIGELGGIGRYIKERRLEAEKRKDDELRAKLNGESGSFGIWTMTDHLSRESRLPIAVRFRSN